MYQVYQTFPALRLKSPCISYSCTKYLSHILRHTSSLEYLKMFDSSGSLPLFPPHSAAEHHVPAGQNLPSLRLKIEFSFIIKTLHVLLKPPVRSILSYPLQN